MTYRRGLFTCLDDYCNGHSFTQMPMPPSSIVDPKNTDTLNCFTCSYSGNSPGDNEACFLDPPASSAVQCGPEDNVCIVDFSDEASTHGTRTMTIDRKCNFDQYGEPQSFSVRQIVEF